VRDRGDSGRSDKRRHRSPAEEARRSPLLWGVVIFGIVVFVLIYLFDSPDGSTVRSSEVNASVGSWPRASSDRLVIDGCCGIGRV